MDSQNMSLKKSKEENDMDSEDMAAKVSGEKNDIDIRIKTLEKALNNEVASRKLSLNKIFFYGFFSNQIVLLLLIGGFIFFKPNFLFTQSDSSTEARSAVNEMGIEWLNERVSELNYDLKSTVSTVIQKLEEQSRQVHGTVFESLHIESSAEALALSSRIDSIEFRINNTVRKLSDVVQSDPDIYLSHKLLSEDIENLKDSQAKLEEKLIGIEGRVTFVAATAITMLVALFTALVGPLFVDLIKRDRRDAANGKE